MTRTKIKNNAVNSAKVAPRSLRASDFALGQIPRGPQGLQGIQGIDGKPGNDGKNGATNLVVRTTLVGSSLGATNKADCNDGERAIGGGVSRSDGSYSANDVIGSSFPIADKATFTPAPAGSTATAWFSGIKLNPAAASTFYVVCASP